MTESQKLILLKKLLLEEDRDFANSILQKLELLENTVNIEENLSQKINPIIDKKIEAFTEEVPRKLGPAITEALGFEIKNSQDKIVDVLFPIIGKMIKKYIQQEMKILTESINNQLQNTFSFKKISRKFKSIFSGASESEIILSELNKSKIEQIFIIEKGSGLLLSSTSNEGSIDRDMIAGMLTAIKSFVEDAFLKKDQNLELIQYELYNIHIQNFASYYIAVVVSGVFDTNFKNELEDSLFDFASKHINKNISNSAYITEKLKELIK
ncbi:cell envelope biogenesis protein OmpA [Flavobacterium faecale]|uniref:Cell envelope biogenesis protein OmpA n=1 Tax=Flavobacterium faecale TaxID=1355330 RepID=A0A2S1LBI1_9FLAO|nr:cell envelope biogenesis protein OmpA [Flavobacterium faecale]AWG21115.1 cell envelope biogenesis protein OmpA [Flavobacterium faecale]